MNRGEMGDYFSFTFLAAQSYSALPLLDRMFANGAPAVCGKKTYRLPECHQRPDQLCTQWQAGKQQQWAGGQGAPTEARDGEVQGWEMVGAFQRK